MQVYNYYYVKFTFRPSYFFPSVKVLIANYKSSLTNTKNCTHKKLTYLSLQKEKNQPKNSNHSCFLDPMNEVGKTP